MTKRQFLIGLPLTIAGLAAVALGTKDVWLPELLHRRTMAAWPMSPRSPVLIDFVRPFQQLERILPARPT